MRQCLIVDDSNIIRKVARKILEDLRYEVIEAESGSQALELCAGTLPDAILLDWHMPDMMGLETLQKLRTGSEDRKPYIVYAITENDGSEITRAMTAGADDYVLKPYDRRDLEAKFSATSDFA